MKSRQIYSLLFICLVGSHSLVQAKDLPSKRSSHLEQRSERVKRQSDAVSSLIQLALKFAPILMNTFIGGGGGGGFGDLAGLIAPLFGGGGGGGSPGASAAATATPKPGGSAVANKITPVTEPPTTINKVDKIGGDTDIFSISNILSVGLKVALALFSSYTTGGGIDRDGNEITPLQTAMGTLISALTGSDDPKEVAVMAKQAVDVVNLISTVFEALRTSIF